MPSIKVATWNIYMGKDMNFKDIDLSKDSKNLLKSEGYNIVGLQEVMVNRSISVSKDPMTALSSGVFPYNKYYKSSELPGETTAHRGNGLLSAYPMTNHVQYRMPYESTSIGTEEPRYLDKAEIVINGKRIYVFVVHVWHNSTSVRNKQLKFIKDKLDELNGASFILLGDFNTWEKSDFNLFSSSYQIINGYKGNWFDTWNFYDASWPNRAIDNVICSKDFRIKNYGMKYTQLSDHSIVYATLEWDDNGEREKDIQNNSNSTIIPYIDPAGTPMLGVNKIVVTSLNSGVKYVINSTKSYRIESSIEIPADSFELIAGNYKYEVSSLISSGDKIEFFMNNELAMEGYIDDIDIEYSLGSNDMRITGRDIISVLLDNDAEPTTFNNLGLLDYLAKVLPKYGIKFSSSNNTKFEKIVVSPGENEYSVIERLCKERNLVPIYDIKSRTLNCVKPVSTKTSSYWFSNQYPNSIRIKDAQIAISNDIKNEVIVYGGDYEKNKNIKGSYVDNTIKTKKRRILNESEIESNADANKKAKEEFYHINKNALSVELVTTTKMPIYINKSAWVDIAKAKFTNYLLVEKVVYSKSKDSGSLTNITLKIMPGIKVNYANNNIPFIPII